MKIFIDDLELAIRKRGRPEFSVMDTKEENVDKNALEEYLKDKFNIWINEKKIDLQFIGFEFDQDAILCYLEGEKIRKINMVEIENGILSEVFDDQINLTHFQYSDGMKSLKATADNLSGVIDTSSW